MKKKKIFKIISIILNTIVGIAVAGFILAVCLQRFSNNKISFLNYRLFTVVSESMKPKYVIGDVLISKEISPSKVKEGDVISYQGKAGDFAGKVITHQVVKIEKDSNGKYFFHAKGIANLIEDPLVSEDQLYGKVVYKSIILSMIYKVVGTNAGFCLFIILPIVFIVGTELFSTLLEKEEERRNKLS